jgi:hypothetical protein
LTTLILPEIVGSVFQDHIAAVVAIPVALHLFHHGLILFALFLVPHLGLGDNPGQLFYRRSQLFLNRLFQRLVTGVINLGAIASIANI